MYLWNFQYFNNLQYKDGSLQYLVKRNKYAATNHAELFVWPNNNNNNDVMITVTI